MRNHCCGMLVLLICLGCGWGSPGFTQAPAPAEPFKLPLGGLNIIELGMTADEVFAAYEHRNSDNVEHKTGLAPLVVRKDEELLPGVRVLGIYPDEPLWSDTPGLKGENVWLLDGIVYWYSEDSQSTDKVFAEELAELSEPLFAYGAPASRMPDSFAAKLPEFNEPPPLGTQVYYWADEEAGVLQMLMRSPVESNPAIGHTMLMVLKVDAAVEVKRRVEQANAAAAAQP